MKYGSLFDPFTGKETVDDAGKRAFLQSAAYCNMIRKMVVGITGDHSLIVYILPINHPELAFTDGKYIMVNTLHPLFIMEPIEDITVYCLALATHESLHPLYSCFQCIEDAARKRSSDNDNIVYVRRSVFNILEDARIERIGRFKFPGVSYAIDQLNEFLYEKVEDLDKLKDIELMMQWLLDFVSVDKIRGELPDHLKPIWEKVKPLATKAKYSDTCSRCYYYTKRIMKLISPLIPENDPLDNRQQKPENNQGNNTDVDAETGEVPPGMSNSNSGGKSGKKQKQNQGSQGQDDQNSQGSAGGNQQNDQSSGNGQSNSQSAGDSQGQGQDNSQKQGDGQGGGQASQQNNAAGSNSPSGPTKGGSGQANASEMTKEQMEAEAREISQMLQNSLNASYNEHKQDQVNDAQDSSRMRKLQTDPSNACKVVPHYGNYDNLPAYEIVKSSVAAVTRNLKKGLKNILNYNVDEMSRYLHSGRIDSKSLSRMPTGAICAKRIEKNDEADLNITVLVDMSGSMNGTPIYYAKAACVVLYEVCRELKVPITVLGFRSGRPTEVHYFADTNLKGRYTHTGIVSMVASGGTPLDKAMNYLPVHLKKQDQEDKLVIIITDGEPEEDTETCRATVKKLSANAKVYGLAIGTGRSALARIFGTRYIGIDSLEKLPKELCKIIEKNLFRR